jgi:hypothetical protein
LADFRHIFSPQKSTTQFAFGFAPPEPDEQWIQNAVSLDEPARLKGIET